MCVLPTILQILPALGTGGVERGTIEIAKAITEAGGKALVASAGGIWQQRLHYMGGKHFTLPLHSKNPLILLKNRYRLQKIIRENHVDIVHARSRAPAWSAWAAAKTCNVPFMTTWHGVYQENWQGKRLYNQVMAKGVKVIAISNYIAKRLQEQYHVTEDQLRIVPRGVDTLVFNPELPLGDRIHQLVKQWQLPEGKKIILLPGRLTSWKGHSLLLDALANLKRIDSSWICVFVGPAKDKDHFVKDLLLLAKQLNIRDQLYFAGNCQDMPAALALADFVVVPSLKPEPFGRVVIEAQAMQKAVVVANHGGAAETVKDRETGFLFSPGNCQSLTEVLIHAIQAPAGELNWIGRQAREEVEQHYTLSNMQQATLRIYNEILPPLKQLTVL